jgi:hypothetical protein
MATQRVIHEDTPPNPVNPDICSSFQAQLGAQVTFGGVIGSQTIDKVGNIWPFNLPYPMTVPNVATIRILNNGTLSVGQTYPYSVSQACIEGIQRGVTIIT